MKRILSGIQPSGQLHLGNYFGMMQRMIRYQEESNLFCFIVNYHALTTIQDQKKLKKSTVDAACDFLALGLDPEKATFWIQSDVPQVTELTWLLACITSVGLMERSTSYKDKLARGIAPNMGLFSYPILMAADILCYGAEFVPVGKDQKQHLEISRDIAQRFNRIYGDILVIPEAAVEDDTQLVPGVDGNKMSKSYGNIIPIFADEMTIKKSVFSIQTDSTPVNEPKNIDTPIFKLYSLFLTDDNKAKLKERFQSPGLKYGEIKGELADKMIEYFRPFREQREYFESHRDSVVQILQDGAQKASKVADSYLTKIREAMGLSY
ncbi:tryptophan--tRNA ligase [Candidatus Neomarinimicrobiota bacterium]